jgi:N-acetylmuramoyl-L-alanine amidase
VKGNSEGSQILEGDAIVQQVRMIQRRHSADLVVTLGPKSETSEVYFDEAEKKLIIDVYSSAAVPDAPLPLASTSGPVKAPESSAAKVTRSSPAPAHKIAVLPARKLSPDPVITAAPDLSERERRSPLPPEKNSTRTIVIDAGHGGMDSGAIGSRGTMEKDVNLHVARALAEALRKEKGFRVILTRNSDEFIPLNKRTDIANHARADLFVSIHCNASQPRGALLFEVLHLKRKSKLKKKEN